MRCENITFHLSLFHLSLHKPSFFSFRYYIILYIAIELGSPQTATITFPSMFHLTLDFRERTLIDCHDQASSEIRLNQGVRAAKKPWMDLDLHRLVYFGVNAPLEECSEVSRFEHTFLYLANPK